MDRPRKRGAKYWRRAARSRLWKGLRREASPGSVDPRNPGPDSRRYSAAVSRWPRPRLAFAAAGENPAGEEGACVPTARNHRGRTRLAAVVAVSGLAHIAALALLGLTTPTLRTAARDEVAITPVELWRPPSTVAARRRPAATPSPVSPRRARASASTAAVAPLPFAPVRDDGPASPPTASRGIMPPPGLAGADLRGALRRSTVGCANRDALSMTRLEREACDDRYARGREDDPFIAPPMDAGKRAEFDAIAARKDRVRKRKEAPPPAGISPSDNAGGTRTNGIGILGY